MDKEKLLKAIQDGIVTDEKSFRDFQFHSDVISEIETIKEEIKTSSTNTVEILKEIANKEIPEFPSIPETVFPDIQNVKVINNTNLDETNLLLNKIYKSISLIDKNSETVDLTETNDLLKKIVDLNITIEIV